MKIDIEEIELCLDMHYQTEIVITRPLIHQLGDDLVRIQARGAVTAARRQQYVRPMFEVMPVPIGAPFLIHQVPCASCGDFSRSWNCEAHTYWSPVGDEDDLTVEEEAGFRTAFPDSPVMRNIQAMIAESAGRLPAGLMPRTRAQEIIQSPLHGIIEQFGLDDED